MGDHWATGRMEAFSDGVFAIEITLLAPNIGLYIVIIALGFVAPRAAIFGYLAIEIVALLRMRGDSLPTGGKQPADLEQRAVGPSRQE